MRCPRKPMTAVNGCIQASSSIPGDVSRKPREEKARAYLVVLVLRRETSIGAIEVEALLWHPPWLTVSEKLRELYVRYRPCVWGDPRSRTPQWRFCPVKQISRRTDGATIPGSNESQLVALSSCIVSSVHDNINSDVDDTLQTTTTPQQVIRTLGWRVWVLDNKLVH